jgi:hypothetical protein
MGSGMTLNDRIEDRQAEDSRSGALSGSQAEKVRAGVTGHNVRYVLGVSLVGVIFIFAVVAYLSGMH